MVIDLIVGFPDAVIKDARVRMKTHPRGHCTSIVDDYRKLAGLSIARGFSQEVRELFGGPRACAHTTALLQAMAPVAIQSIWSMRQVSQTEQMVAPPIGVDASPEELRAQMAYNVNACHVWSNPGPMFDAIDRREEPAPPIWVVERAEELGQSVVSWRERMSGRSSTNSSIRFNRSSRATSLSATSEAPLFMGTGVSLLRRSYKFMKPLPLVR
jgi:hypothetical protein